MGIAATGDFLPSSDYVGWEELNYEVSGKGHKEAASVSVSITNPLDWAITPYFYIEENHTHMTQQFQDVDVQPGETVELEDLVTFEYGDGDITEFTDVDVCINPFDGQYAETQTGYNNIGGPEETENLEVRITDATGQPGSAYFYYEVTNKSDDTVEFEYLRQMQFYDDNRDQLYFEDEERYAEVDPGETYSNGWTSIANLEDNGTYTAYIDILSETTVPYPVR